MCVWVPAAALNFWLVPPVHRVLYVSVSVCCGANSDALRLRAGSLLQLPVCYVRAACLSVATASASVSG
jgi:hypothetical protein